MVDNSRQGLKRSNTIAMGQGWFTRAKKGVVENGKKARFSKTKGGLQGPKRGDMSSFFVTSIFFFCWPVEAANGVRGVAVMGLFTRECVNALLLGVQGREYFSMSSGSALCVVSRERGKSPRLMEYLNTLFCFKERRRNLM